MTHTIEQSVPPRETSAGPGHPDGGPAEPSALQTGHPVAAVVQRAGEINSRWAPPALRIALALVFVWFGALKIGGVSPVRELIAQTLPFIDPDVSLPVLGVVEVAIGLALLIGRFPRLTLLVLAGHLVGTFLSYPMAPELMVQHGRPWELTADGEFVLKNLVLISAALVLISVTNRRSPAEGN
jgi:putative oxidoreductase